ncbi:MAG TPA: hypothetical protein VKC60_11685, partial [Opitutaceae bacterium]|nr:hypothetical protein [Opitutaceae bacterium]
SNRRTFEGASDESIEQLRQSLAGMNADISSLAKQANPANRFQVLNLLDRIGVELALMEIRLAEWRIDVQKNYSVEEKTISNYKEQLANARTSVEKLGFKAASL